uniref:Fibronectin type-III domain-containing protein n=1 Tax=Photinus pyralis TaxID=7054 RepID=A0A1Y1KAX6_PHOPY
MLSALILFFFTFQVYFFPLNAQKIPQSVTAIEATQMTSTVAYLKWRKPESNFTLTHYDVQFSEIGDEYLDAEEYLTTVDGIVEHAKLTGLKTNQRYIIYIYSIFQEVASHPSTVDIKLTWIDKYLPIKPDFRHELKNDGKDVGITWLPNIKNPGDRFFASYRKKGDAAFVNSKSESESLSIDVRNVERNHLYEFYVTACYGNQMAISDIKEIHT